MKEASQAGPAPWLAKLRPVVDAIELPVVDFPSPQAPAWTERAFEQIAHPLAPREFFDSGPPTTLGLAKVLGWLDSVTAIFNGEVPLAPELEAKLAQALEAYLKSLPPHRRPSIRDMRRNLRRWERLRAQIRRLVRRALSAAQARPFVEAQAFLDAYRDGVAAVSPEKLFDHTLYSRNQKLLFTLQYLWPVMPKLGSVGELHRQLTQALGEPKVGDLKNLQRLTGQIGLRFRGRGRPRKQK